MILETDFQYEIIKGYALDVIKVNKSAFYHV